MLMSVILAGACDTGTYAECQAEIDHYYDLTLMWIYILIGLWVLFLVVKMVEIILTYWPQLRDAISKVLDGK